MKLRRLFLLFLLLSAFSMNILSKPGDFFVHIVEPGQTVYAISKIYKVSVENIYELNPASVNGIKVGEELKIPETLGIKQPASKDEKSFVPKQSEKLTTINMALLLPFPTGNRIVEYYEGVLLALRTVKEEGISVDLQVYNTGIGMDSVYTILKNPKLKKANVIIGGLSEAQIKAIAEYSHANNIAYAIPLASQSDIPAKYTNVFQINTPQSHSYTKAATAFVKKYQLDNIIFYTPNGSGNKMDFIKLLKKELTLSNVAFRTINTTDELAPLLSTDKNNIIIPSDDSETVLLQSIVALKIATENNQTIEASLFGYPSWQLHSSKYLDDFSRFNITFYSLFYADPTSPQVKTFRNNYARWYSKNLINTFPKYGMLGYDTSLYFIQLLHKYGKSHDNQVNKVNSDCVQMYFNFERAGATGGFINTHLYFVQFHPGTFITTLSIK